MDAHRPSDKTVSAASKYAEDELDAPLGSRPDDGEVGETETA